VAASGGYLGERTDETGSLRVLAGRANEGNEDAALPDWYVEGTADCGIPVRASRAANTTRGNHRQMCEAGSEIIDRVTGV